MLHWPLNRICLILFQVILLCACSGDTVKDVTSNDGFWGGYRKNKIYVLKENIFLLKFPLEQKFQFALSPEGKFKDSISRYYTVPFSTSGYARGGLNEGTVSGRYYQIETEVDDIIEKGTGVQPIKLIKTTSLSWFFGKSVDIVIFGQLLDGPHSGLIVNMNDISIKSTTEDAKINWPNKYLLELK